MTTTHRITRPVGRKWVAGIGITVGGAVAAAALATISGFPAHADADTYSDLLNGASTEATDALDYVHAAGENSVQADSPEILFFTGEQSFFQELSSHLVDGAEPLQDMLKPVEQTSPGVLAADQELLTAYTDLANADKTLAADPGSLTNQLDVLTVDLTQIIPAGIEQNVTDIAAIFAGVFGVPLP
ncbi:hypothetical protein [Mycobacterium sp.]|uniref:hypothetical protein n=1 Tax=Mycobacterium sp. TaxID=1785 RepID=UPI0031D61CB6